MLVSPDAHLMTPEGLYHWTQERVLRAWELSRREYSEALASGSYKKVVLMMGAPGSGKSTWYSKNKQQGVLYFDAVFKNPKSREAFVRQARRLNLPVEVVWLDTPLEECLRRNSLRTPDRKVEEGIVKGMWETIQKFPPDPRREGFTLIRVVPEVS